MIQGYVVGLMFRFNFRELALITKARPTWQAGKLNGVGGKIEQLESPYAAMVREFQEETGYTQIDWHMFAETYWQTGFVRYFTCQNDSAQLKSITDEKVDWYGVESLMDKSMVGKHLIPNMNWIIPMAIQYFHEPFLASVDYSHDPAIKQINDAKNNSST